MLYRNVVRACCVVLTVCVSIVVLAGCDTNPVPVNVTNTATPVVSPATPTPISQERRMWAIRQAKDAASQFPSSPRIYNIRVYEKYVVDKWPDDVGSTTTTYDTGGGAPTDTPVKSLPTLPRPTPALMTLSTLVSGAGTDIEVIFESAWGESNPERHRWRVRVAPDGHATLIEETGPPLPDEPS